MVDEYTPRLGEAVDNAAVNLGARPANPLDGFVPDMEFSEAEAYGDGAPSDMAFTEAEAYPSKTTVSAPVSAAHQAQKPVVPAYDEELARAQGQAGLNKALGGIGAGYQQMLATSFGAPYNAHAVDKVTAGANDPVKNLLAAREAAKTAKLDEADAAYRDPNSKMSKVRRILLERYGMTGVDDMSAQDIDKLGLVGQGAVDARSRERLAAEGEMNKRNYDARLAGISATSEARDKDRQARLEAVKMKINAKRGGGGGKGGGAGRSSMTYEEALKYTSGDEAAAKQMLADQTLRRGVVKGSIDAGRKAAAKTSTGQGITTKAEMEAQREYGKRRDALEDMNTNLQALEADIGDSGEIPGKGVFDPLQIPVLQSVGSDLGMDSAQKAARIDKRAKAAVASYMRSISGKTVTDQERAVLNKIVGTGKGQSEYELREGLKMLKNLGQQQEGNLTGSFPEHIRAAYNKDRNTGGPVSGVPNSQVIGKPSPEAGAPARVRVKDAKTGTIGFISADKVDAAVKSGRFTVAE